MSSIKSTIFYLVLLISLSTIVLIFVVFPTAESIKQNKQLLSAKLQTLSDQEERISALKTVQKNPDDQKSKIESVNALWPSDKAVSNFIVDLENMANKENITLRNITVSESSANSKKKNKWSEIQFSFDTKAEFNQNLNTIKSLEKFNRFNSIKQIGLTKDNEGLISMKLTGSIYYGD